MKKKTPTGVFALIIEKEHSLAWSNFQEWYRGFERRKSASTDQLFALAFEYQLGVFLKYFRDNGIYLRFEPASKRAKKFKYIIGGVHPVGMYYYEREEETFGTVGEAYIEGVYRAFEIRNIGCAVRKVAKENEFTVHIMKVGGEWMVKKHGKIRALRVFRKNEKKEAVDYAQRFRYQGYTVAIHKRDGSIGRRQKPFNEIM